MALFDSIAESQKRDIMEATRIGLLRELYNLLVLVGIDPDTYVLGSLKTYENPAMDSRYIRINEIDAAVQMIDEKMAG